jgi:hypothetical protein
MASTSASSLLATLIVLSLFGKVLLILNPCKEFASLIVAPESIQQVQLKKLYTISHVVSLFLTMPTNTLRHVILFLHGSFALLLGRRGLKILRITFLRLRKVREILLLMVLHVVDRITL